LSELKLAFSGIVDNDNPVVDTIHQIYISFGAYRDITGLVGVWFNIEKKFAGDTILSEADI
jgi:hypothetical protein